MIIGLNSWKWLENLSDQEKGTHPTMYRAACQALEEGWNKQEAYGIVRILADYSDRRVPDSECMKQVDSAEQGITGANPREGWPRPDLGLRVEVLRRYAVEPSYLRRQIPHRSASEALARLYRPQDLVCVGRTATDFETLPLDLLKEPELLEFINPSPMCKLFGETQAGTFSAHAKSNTGPRVYAVIEFDSGEPLEHVALHKFLRLHLPLAALVYSGATSVHGWFKASHVDEGRIRNFYNLAISLGADPKMHSPCQFTRLPGGRHRGTGRRQTLLYLNSKHAYHQKH